MSFSVHHLNFSFVCARSVCVRVLSCFFCSRYILVYTVNIAFVIRPKVSMSFSVHHLIFFFVSVIRLFVRLSVCVCVCVFFFRGAVHEVFEERLRPVGGGGR